MPDNHERRISTVEAHMENLASSMDDIRDYVGKLFSETGDIKTGLALLVQNQEGMKEYQKRCDAERNDHEKRITATEGFQNRAIKFVVALTGIGSLASPQLSKLWERFFS